MQQLHIYTTVLKKKTVKSEKPKTRITSKKKSPAQKQSQRFYTLGIGASAGGLEALKTFFDHTQPDSGMAYVVIQHLDPTHKSILSELIAGHTAMPVTEISDGMAIKSDSVYVIPPNRDLEVLNGHLHLSAPRATRKVRRTIDTFFQSLAADQQENAVGVILSGTGTEGSQGLKDIKSAGGITIVQDPKTALFAGMPANAINTQMPDYILSPDKIYQKLKQSLERKGKGRRTEQKSEPDSGIETPLDHQLKRIFLIIRNQTGCDFSNYKSNTIARRIRKRADLLQIASLDDYVLYLQDHHEETEKLYKEFLIGVTSFFRNREVFSVIEKRVIPDLFVSCREKQEIRVWICGCSTGEEAYSLAILFKEALHKKRQFLKVVIFASDLDKDAIDFARNGLYPDTAIADVSEERLAQYFIKKGNDFQLRKEIREMVVFAHHNVIKDPPFSKVDLISCRNLLIYMNNDLQRKIIAMFHYSLNRRGILVLGTSESIGEYSAHFETFDSNTKIFRRKPESIRREAGSSYELPPVARHQTILPDASPAGTGKRVANIAGIAEKILLDQYAPPSVLIDKSNTAVYFSGNTGQFLEQPKGEASLNILEMAKTGLRSFLEPAIQKARRGGTEIVYKDIDVKVNAHLQTIHLRVKPMLTKIAESGFLLIVFEQAITAISKETSKLPADTVIKKPRVTELEKELRITREHLQTAINELETANEDLQTANEEFQSSNEELQSTNEELETSREELQSVNEELITVNAELSGKIEQLSESNDDLNNLLSSIDVATIFLDRELKIKRFTPSATKLFNLIPADIDRPVTHLTSNFTYKTLTEDLKTSLRTLGIKTADVMANDGTWYQMRIVPYRTAENMIEGVLLTFVDIGEHKKVEEKLKKSNQHLTLIMESIPAVPFICIVEPEFRIQFVDQSCEKVTGFLPEQFTGKPSFWINRIHPDDRKKLMDAFSAISKKGSLDMPFRWKCIDGKYKSFINFIRYTASENGRQAYIVGVWKETIQKKKI